MTRYLFDTNHASLLYRQDPRLQTRFTASTDRVLLCLPSIGELWYMVYNSTRVDENAVLMERFLSGFQHLEYDTAAARESGRVRAEARRRGRQLAGVDGQIAAIAVVNDLILFTDDQDFNGVFRLKTDNWIR